MKTGIGAQPWVGLDVGTHSVKLVAVQGGVAGARYMSAEAPYATGSEEGDPRPAPEAIARSIADALSSVNLSPRGLRGVSLGIAGADVIVKQISMPLLEDAELAPALRFEARKHMPFDPQTMVLDYQVLARNPETHQVELLLAAVARDRLERQMAPLKMLGIEAAVVDAAPLALANATAHHAPAAATMQILLDVGQSASHLVIVHRGQPFFARRFDFGGHSLTRALAEGLGVSATEAEARKRALAPKDGSPGAWDSPEWRILSECLRRDLAEEVVRSIAFYRTQAHFTEVPRLAVSGGSARLPGFASRLGEALGASVDVFDPFGSMTSTRPGQAPLGGPQFAQAFGLVLRAA